MKKLSIIALAVIMSSCCMSQIQNQFYFAGIDSCEFYLPDYTQAITLRDNCCVGSISQTPAGGERLIPGNDITVEILGEDCYGNTASMQFEVILIDTIPPSFEYDSSLFIPTGMYQDEDRTYSFYTVIDSIYRDELGNYSHMTHYYK